MGSDEGDAGLAMVELVVDEVRRRFPLGAAKQVQVLEYSGHPGLEPAGVVVRVAVDPVRVADEDALWEFQDTHRDALEQLRCDLVRLFPGRLAAGAVQWEPNNPGGRADPVGAAASFDLVWRYRVAGPIAEATPVLTRLTAEDLETLDTLIGAGIVADRPEAVRWALARLREQPVYQQVRARAREIEEHAQRH
jgi:hypothetical protein